MRKSLEDLRLKHKGKHYSNLIISIDRRSESQVEYQWDVGIPVNGAVIPLLFILIVLVHLWQKWFYLWVPISNPFLQPTSNE